MNRVGLLGVSACVASCSLLTSFDEYTAGGGPSATNDGGPDATPFEAGPGPSDAATIEDAGADATPPSKYRAAVIADRPVGYWRLGERRGTVAKDEIGAHDGTYVGGITLGVASAAPDGDPAITFDGTSGKVVIGNVFGFAGKSFSVETWVNVPVIDADIRYIVAKETSANGGGGWFVAMNRIDQNGVGFGVFQNGLYSRWTFPIVPNAWVHHVGTFSTSDIRAYINGNLGGSFDPQYSAVEHPRDLVFGASAENTSFFRGSLDEVALYDYALPAERVKAHYDARQ